MLPGTSPNANDALLEAIVDGLRLSSIFNFEPIQSLPNIALIKTHPLFKLIRIFVLGQGLAQCHEALPEFEPELAKHSVSPPIEKLDRRLFYSIRFRQECSREEDSPSNSHVVDIAKYREGDFVC